MVIAVVGIGIVGKTLVEHFTHLGYDVLQIERQSSLTLAQAAKMADVVFVVTRPIDEVNDLLRLAGENMRPGKLLVHGTSVEMPYGQRTGRKQILEKGITLAHVHFHFRPESPLRETLRGQHITVKIEGLQSTPWAAWLGKVFDPYQPFIHALEGDEHDATTASSQLEHMITAFEVSSGWRATPSEILQAGITIGGPPCRFLVRSVLRSASGAGVAAEILACHPETLSALDRRISALIELAEMVKRKNAEAIETRLATPRQLIGSEALHDWDVMTARLIRLEADLQRQNVVLNFPAEQNRVGLLARVLGEFDARGVDKTTTIAQTNPDGSCTFVIGVREHTPAVDEAVTAVEGWEKE